MESSVFNFIGINQPKSKEKSPPIEIFNGVCLNMPAVFSVSGSVKLVDKFVVSEQNDLI